MHDYYYTTFSYLSSRELVESSRVVCEWMDVMTYIYKYMHVYIYMCVCMLCMCINNNDNEGGFYTNNAMDVLSGKKK